MYIIIILLSLSVGILASTLQLPLIQDSSVHSYAAWCMNQLQLVPYKDLLEENTPGIFYLLSLWTRLFSDTDYALRLLDISFMIICFFATWGIYKFEKDKKTVLKCSVSFLIFTIFYYFLSKEFQLERDFLGFTFVIMSFVLLINFNKTKWIDFASGLLFGCALMIKPQLIIFLLLLFAIKRINYFMYALASAFVLATMILTLHLQGGLDYFIFAVKYIWPQYNSLPLKPWDLTPTQTHFEAFKSVFSYRRSFIPIFISIIYIASFYQLNWFKKNTLLKFLYFGTCTSIVYASIGFKFFPYYFYPAGFFCSILLVEIAGLTYDNIQSLKKYKLIISSFIITFFLSLFHFYQNTNFRYENPILQQQQFAVQKIYHFLKLNLLPNEKVQTMGWVLDGNLQYMRMLKIPMATKYLFTYYFTDFHQNEIQPLVDDFLSDLTSSSPRYIIVGPSTTRGKTMNKMNPQIKEYIINNYKVVLGFPGLNDFYLIFEKTLK